MPLLNGQEPFLMGFRVVLDAYKRDISQLDASNPSYCNGWHTARKKSMIGICAKYHDFVCGLWVSLLKCGMEKGCMCDEFFRGLIQELHNKSQQLDPDLDKSSKSSFDGEEVDKQSESSYDPEAEQKSNDSQSAPEGKRSVNVKDFGQLSDSGKLLHEFNHWMNTIEYVHHDIFVQMTASIELDNGLIAKKEKDLHLIVTSMKKYFEYVHQMYYNP
jgi:hypothetical protein